MSMPRERAQTLPEKSCPPFEKTVKAQKRGHCEAKYSDNGQVVPYIWSLERDRVFAIKYLAVGSRHQDVEVERQTEQRRNQDDNGCNSWKKDCQKQRRQKKQPAKVGHCEEFSSEVTATELRRTEIIQANPEHAYTRKTRGDLPHSLFAEFFHNVRCD
jgi:hypothetical protein